jgi:flagellar hook-associated protein 1
MSINAILNNAYTGLAASQASMRVISNNIANVNTANYAREAVGLESLVAGGVGNGVRIADVRRVADQFLERAVYTARADSSRNDVLAQFHERLQGLLGRPDSEASLPARLDSIFASVADLSLDSLDVVRKAAVISDIERFTDEITKLSNDVQQIRSDASNQIVDTVSNINAALERIHELNPLIVRARLIGNETAGLEQQRAQAIGRLTEYLDVSVIDRANGSVEIATGTGQVLVDTRLRTLSYQSPGAAAPETNFPQIIIRAIDTTTGNQIGNAEPFDAAVQSGKLRALLDIRDVVMPDIADGLGEFARVFREEINAVHSQYSAAPAPQSLTGIQSGLLAGDLEGFSGRTTFGVVDSSGTLVAKTTVDFSALPAGSTINDVLTAINSGLGGAATATLTNGVLSITATNGTHGVVLADDPAAPSSRGGRTFAQTFGLNFLIASSALTTASGMTLTNPHGFNAGGTMGFEVRDANNRILVQSSLTVSGTSMNDMLALLNDPVGLGSVFTFALDSNGAMTHTPKPGFKDVSLHVIADSTTRGTTGMTVSDYFGLDQSTQALSAVDLRVNSDFVSDPSRLALAKFDPAIAVGQPAIGRSDNRGAVALRALETASVKFSAAGEIAGVEAKLSAYSGFLLGNIAVQADAAATAKDDTGVLYDNVLKRRDDYAGVNLDEELASMVVFQNSYTASARLMTAARDMYDVLLSIAQ